MENRRFKIESILPDFIAIKMARINIKNRSFITVMPSTFSTKLFSFSRSSTTARVISGDLEERITARGRTAPSAKLLNSFNINKIETAVTTAV